MKFNCIDFHRPEWTHRKLSKYYVKLDDGQVLFIWAYDVCDACNSVLGNIIEYGKVFGGYNA